MVDRRTRARKALPWRYPDRYPASLAMDPHALTLVAIPRYRPIAHVYDPVLGTLLGDLRGTSLALYAPTVSSDGAWIDACGHNGELHRWRSAAFDERRTLSRARPRARSDDWRPLGDGSRAVCRVLDGERQHVELVDTRTGSVVHDLGPVPKHSETPRATPGQEAVLVERDAGLDVIAVADGRRLATVARRLSHASTNTAMTHVAGIAGDRVMMFELASGREVFAVHAPGTQYVAVSPEADRVLTADGGANSATAWHVTDPAQKRSVTHAAFVFDAVFTPDGEQVLSFGNDTRVRLTRLRAPAADLVIRAPTGDFGWLGIDARGRFAAVVTPEETSLLELPSGRRRMRWHPKTIDECISSVVFTPDGQHLLVQLHDGRQRLLPLDPLAMARTLAPRAMTGDERVRFGLPAATDTTPTAAPPVTARLQFAIGAITRGQDGDLAAARHQLDLVDATRRRPPLLYHVARLLLLGAEVQAGGAAPTAAQVEQALAGIDRCTIGGQAVPTSLREHPRFAVMREMPAVAARLSAAGR